MSRKLTDEEKSYLLDLLKNCETEDDFVRKIQIASWKRNELFFHGIQYLYWSETLGDWRVSGQSGANINDNIGEETRDATQPFYDYVINIIKAHGEGIISALSQKIPTVEIPPIDADNDADLTASRTKTKLAEILQRKLGAKLIWMSALFKLYNEGIV